MSTYNKPVVRLITIEMSEETLIKAKAAASLAGLPLANWIGVSLRYCAAIPMPQLPPLTPPGAYASSAICVEDDINAENN